MQNVISLRFRVRVIVAQCAALFTVIVCSLGLEGANYVEETAEHLFPLREPGYWSLKLEPTAINTFFVVGLALIPPAIFVVFDTTHGKLRKVWTLVVPREFATWTFASLITLCLISTVQATLDEANTIAFAREIWANVTLVSGLAAGLSLILIGLTRDAQRSRESVLHGKPFTLGVELLVPEKNQGDAARG